MKELGLLIENVPPYLRVTVDDAVFIILHAALYGVLIYGVYYQKVRQKLHVWLSSSRRTLQDSLTSIYSLISRKGQSAVSKFKRWLRPLKPGVPQTIHLRSIGSTVRMSDNIQVRIQRGEESWAHFTLAWTVISVVFATVDDMYQPLASTSYGLLTLLIDIMASIWLCFYCGWFRNKIIGIVYRRNRTPD